MPDTTDVLQREQVPEQVKTFYRVNNIRRFRYDRAFHRGARDRDNEFKVELTHTQAHTHTHTHTHS